MIPILYKPDSNGWPDTTIARLRDCLSCYIEEEANGKFECVLEYPTNGYMVDYIKVGYYVYLYYPQTWYDDEEYQYFRIYKIGKTLHGKMTIYGEHISYRLADVLLKMKKVNAYNEAVGAASPHWMMYFKDGTTTDGIISVQANNDILEKFTTMGGLIDSNGYFSLDSKDYKYGQKPIFPQNKPYTYRSFLFGQEGSILDKFGGFFVFSNYHVFYVHEVDVSDSLAISLRYGHNLSEINYDIDTTSIVGYVIGYVYDQQKDKITYSDKIEISDTEKILNRHTVYVDVSDIYNTLNTTADGTTAIKYTVNDCTNQYIANHKASGDYTLLPESLAVTTERVKGTDNVKIMMPVTVLLKQYNITVKTEIKSLKYDVLLERVDSYEIGKKQRKIADYIG